MDLKKPLSYSEQVDRLIDHKLIVEDRQAAESLLKRVNYYRFTGYALQFRTEANSSDYVENTHFENVSVIVSFDEELRSLLRQYIEIAELYYRTVIAHEFSMKKCAEPPHDQHYDINNFYNKTGYQEIRDHFRKERQYYKDSLILAHHKRHYDGKLPLWAVVEMLSFSDLSKLYNAMYYSERDAIANSVGVSKETLSNHLHCLSVLRNKCAHAARLYNTTFAPKARMSAAFFRKYTEVQNDTLFAYILVLLKRLPSAGYKREFAGAVTKLFDKYKDMMDLSYIGVNGDYASVLMNNSK